jgi:VanZ family protein
MRQPQSDQGEAVTALAVKDRRGGRRTLFAAAALAYAGLILLVGSRPHLRSPVTFPMWDKAAHFGEYGVLGVLAWLAVGPRVRGAGAGVHRLASGAVLLGGIGIGLLDEYIQSRTPGRESSLADLLADAAGVTLGMAAGRFAVARWRRRKEERA